MAGRRSVACLQPFPPHHVRAYRAETRRPAHLAADCPPEHSFYELNDSNEQNVLSTSSRLRAWVSRCSGSTPTGPPKRISQRHGNYGFPLERVESGTASRTGCGPLPSGGKRGPGFLMWFEPERVVAGTTWRKNATVVISPKGNARTVQPRDSEARQYLTDYLNAAIRAYNSRAAHRLQHRSLAYWQFMDAQTRSASAWQKCAMWRVSTACGTTFPGQSRLFIDNCASGGRRIDVETMSRSMPLWRSDNTCDMRDSEPATILQAAIRTN